MRVFLDTNVLVGTAATRGLCADVLREVFASHDLIISDYLIEELRRVLYEKLGVPHDLIEEFIWLLHQDTIKASASKTPPVRLNDITDIPILSAVLNAKADFLVTGDTELQNLGGIGGLCVVSPRKFWEKLKT